MSEASIRRISEHFISQVPTACAEGNSASWQLVQDFMQALATDLAETVFLKMERVVTTTPTDDGEALWQWVQDYPYVQGLEMIAEVTSTMEAYGSSAAQIDAMQIASANAYQTRLNELLETAQPGGAA